MDKMKIKKHIKASEKILKNYNYFKHIFSDDKAKRKLAKLYQTICQLSLLLDFQEVKDVKHPIKKVFEENYDTGKMVKIRPCGEEYGDKTYLGIMLGDAALSTSLSIKRKKLQVEFTHYNPAIFVPELKKVIYGCGSWWSIIENESQFKEISDDVINNVWYVKAMKELTNDSRS